MNKVALVTGAAGFIGRWSVPCLLAAGYEVHAVAGRTAATRNASALPAQLAGSRVHWIDLLDSAAVRSLVQLVRPTHLLHFAWIATPGEYSSSADNYRWVAATSHLLQSFHAAGGVRAVMAGSCAEYDWSRAGECHEQGSPLAGAGGGAVTPYAECKLAMQRELARWSRANHLSSAWGRIFFQFGPDEHPDRVVASVIINLLSGREALCSHGRQIRTFLHVADVGSAFARVLDSGVEGPVNIGSAYRSSLGELLGRTASAIGRPELLHLGARPAPPAEPPVLVPDVERLYREVGWKPHFSMDEAIADTVAWWREKLEGDGAAGEGAKRGGAKDEGAKDQGVTGEGAKGQGVTGEGAKGQGVPGEATKGQAVTGEEARGERDRGGGVQR